MKRLMNVIMPAFICLGITGVANGQDSRQPLEAPPQPPMLERRDAPAVKQQAGIGSNTSYARAGVVEIGGGLKGTSAKDYFELGVAPSIGYFFADNLQISGLLNWSHTKVKGADAQNVLSVIAEPSFHIPTSMTSFAFVGLGLGGLFQEGEKPGLALAPRIGIKQLVGRSGMLTFDIQPILAINSDDDVQTSKGVVLTVNNAINFGLGFSVLL